MSESIRAQSKRDFHTDSSSLDALQCGALLRVADATEKMAQQYDALITDRDYYKRLAAERLEQINALRFSNAGFKAWITRLRRKMQ